MKTHYRSILKNEFESRKQKNSKYSLRAFARYLDIDASSLSKILSGKRGLASVQARHIAKRLYKTEKEKLEFYRLVLESENKNKKCPAIIPEYDFILNEQQHYKLIAEWEYYAILNLVELKNTKSDPEYFAKRLNIAIKRAERVIVDLIEMGFLNHDQEGHYYRTKKKLNTSTETASSALKAAHCQEFELAKESLLKDAIDLRAFYSATVQTDVVKLKAAKKLSIKYLNQLMKLLESSESKTEVYQIGIQIFPLTKVIK